VSLETLPEPTTTTSEFEYVGVLELPQPLGLEQSQSVGLARAPIHLLRATIDERTTQYHAVFEYKPLAENSFRNLLADAAPNDLGSSIYGILADWDLPDLATAHYEQRSNRIDILLADHMKGLKEHWDDFEDSRHLFMRTLAGNTEYSVRNFPDKAIKVQFLSLEEITKRFNAVRHEIGFSDARRIYRSEALPNFIGEVARYLAIDGVVGRRGAERIAEGKTIKIAAQLYSSRKQRYADRYFDALSEEQRAIALDTYARDGYYRIPLEDDKAMFAVKPGPLNAEELLDVYSRRTPQRLKDSKQEVDVAYIRTSLGTTPVIFVHTLQERTGDIRIQPVITWQTRQNGEVTERQLVVDRHPLDELGNPNKSVYESVIGGLLCLAYLSPDIRRDSKIWPLDEQFPGTRKQPLGAAQVPVLALMRRNELLGSPLIAALEEFAS